MEKWVWIFLYRDNDMVEGNKYGKMGRSMKDIGIPMLLVEKED